MKYGVSYQDLKTLAEVNAEANSTLTTSSFTLASAVQTADDIDKAIAASEEFVYPGMDSSDIIKAVNDTLAEMAKPPAGYTLYENYKVFAYISGANNFSELDDTDVKLLVDAANNLGTKTHNSGDCSGNFGNADAYTHNDGANRLFSFKRNGSYTDGYPMVTVVKQGNVNAGTHQF